MRWIVVKTSWLTKPLPESQARREREVEVHLTFWCRELWFPPEMKDQMSLEEEEEGRVEDEEGRAEDEEDRVVEIMGWRAWE